MLGANLALHSLIVLYLWKKKSTAKIDPIEQLISTFNPIH